MEAGAVQAPTLGAYRPAPAKLPAFRPRGGERKNQKTWTSRGARKGEDRDKGAAGHGALALKNLSRRGL